MSVDTHLRGKNLAPYKTMRFDGVKVLLSPNLLSFARTVRLTRKGKLRKRVRAEIGRDEGSCRVE